MTDQAYEEYSKKCKSMGETPSKREDLEHDPFATQSEHQYEPIHIRRPYDFTGKEKKMTEWLDALPDGSKYIITKEWLLEFKDIIERG